MRRTLLFAFLVLVVLFAQVSIGASKASAGSPTQDPIRSISSYDLANPLNIVGIGKNIVCTKVNSLKLCASVSNKYPAKYTYVTVYGVLTKNGIPMVGKTMKTAWYYKTTTPTCKGLTNSNGIAKCKRYISGATSGYKVEIVVTLGGIKATTAFTPQ